MTDRPAHSAHFHALLDRLEAQVGAKKALNACHGRMNWPQRGVYFFFDVNNAPTDGRTSDRVSRIGTHALKQHSRSTFWGRLAQHRGSSRSGGDQHRGSIFRLLTGAALARRDQIPLPPSWGRGSGPGAAARLLGMTRADVTRIEADLERQVSRYIRAMPLLWLNVADAPGSQSDRGFIERNAIALLSAYREPPIDSPPPDWLGHHCDRERVCRSGLWNNNHVDEPYDPAFLDLMETWIASTEPL